MRIMVMRWKKLTRSNEVAAVRHVLTAAETILQHSSVQHALGEHCDMLLNGIQLADPVAVIDGKVTAPEGYESHSNYPIFMMNTVSEVRSNYTKRSPLQEYAVTRFFERSWQHAGHAYTPEQLASIVAQFSPGEDELVFASTDEMGVSGLTAATCRQYYLDSSDKDLLVSGGRPHVALMKGRSLPHTVSSVVHELSHVSDRILMPVEIGEFWRMRLRSELTAYALQVAAARAFREDGFSRWWRMAHSPAADAIEAVRNRVNGPITGVDAFNPNDDIAAALKAEKLDHIYRVGDIASRSSSISPTE